jgi:hypothetical protein
MKVLSVKQPFATLLALASMKPIYRLDALYQLET